jgi:zinc/manganese transport system substrate-binding protein
MFRHSNPRVGVAIALALTLLPLTAAAAPLKVVASVNDLASIAASVGGDRVETAAIARATADVHHVEVLPSYMVRVSRAQVYLKVGLALDQWADQIIDGSRNAKLRVVDCSRAIVPLDRAAGRVDGRAGDAHPEGNPHYWLDPRNGGLVARLLADEFARLDPEGAAGYHQRAEAFAGACAARLAAAEAALAPLPSRSLLTYHASWVYLAAATGLTVIANVEPVPGIPPTGAHLQRLVDLAREQRPQVLLQEPYFSDEAAGFLARETGLRTVKVSPSCDGPQAGSYLDHFDAVIAAITGSR